MNRILRSDLLTMIFALWCLAGTTLGETYNVKATAEGATVAEARETALGKALDAILAQFYRDKTLETKENWIRAGMAACPAYVIQQGYKVVSMTAPENNDLPEEQR